MTGIIIGLYVAAYLSAVVDGIRSRAEGITGLIVPGPEDVPRAGLAFLKLHPWIAVGAVAGIVATVLELAR